MRKLYARGQEVLGAGIGDFVPWLNVVSSVAGGLMGGNKSGDADKQKAAVEAAIKKAMEEKAAKEAKEKAEASARRMQYILFGVLGVVGLGGVYVMARRK